MNADRSLEIVKSRYLQLLVPEGLDPGRPGVRRLVRRIDRRAESMMERQIMDPEAEHCGSWGDVEFDREGRPDGDSFGGRHCSRLLYLARAYAMPRAALRNDAGLLRHIVAAFEYAEPYVRGGGARRGNWWAWDVGIPGRLGDALLLTEGKLPDALTEKMHRALRALVKKRYGRGYHGGGANVLYVARNQLRTAMVTGRVAYAKSAAASYAAMSSTAGELGIQPDWSYHFHGHGLNMGYGRVQLGYVSEFTHLTAGTSFALPEKALRTHEAWFRNFVVWNSYRGRVSPFTVGRSIARDGTVKSPVELEAAVFLGLGAECSCRDLARSFIREWTEANPDAAGRTTALAALAPQYEPMIRDARPMPTGARFFPLSDYLACRKGDFYAAVRMSSTRTKASFSIRGENVRGRRTGDGTLVLMTDGGEWDNAVIPTMNWYALTGVTAAWGHKVPAERPGHSTVVGGLAHRGRWGAAGMDFVVRHGDNALRARKSYTVLDRGVLLLGSRIRLGPQGLPKGRSVHTTLHQCPLREGDRTAIADGREVPLTKGRQELTVKRWLHVRNYGYWFPDPTTVELRVWTSTRSYRHVNRRYHTAPKYMRRFYSLTVDHGGRPEDESYAVMILPAATAERTRAFAREPGLGVVEHSDAAHVLRVEKPGLTVCYFFEAGKAGGLSVGRPLFVATSPEDEGRSVTVQDPTHKGGSIHVELPGGRAVDAKLDGGEPATLPAGP
ncbi:MAG: polysaccharide lyase family 8 super-sandwich domain-containing protein [Planctomycetota bacterium]